MKFGVTAFKYNFKNNKHRKIVVSLSPDLSKLVYHDAKESGAWQVFGSSTSVRLTNFKDVVYGGTTANFKKHQKLLQRL